MKKILALIIVAALLQTGICVNAARDVRFDYILPLEYTSMDIINPYEDYNIISATDKAGNCALYSIDGNKISDDYDSIQSLNESFLWAKRDGISYILNTQGAIIETFEKDVLAVTDYCVFADVSDNKANNKTAVEQYEGEFAVYNFIGDELAVFPYNKFIHTGTPGRLGFYGGMMLFREGDKWGAMNKDFATVVSPVYEELYPFSDTGFAVAKSEGKYGIIDKNGNVKVDFSYNRIWAESYDDNKGYIYEANGRYGIIDENGNIETGAILDKVPDDFYPQQRCVKFSVDNARSDKGRNPKLYGIMSYYGNIVIPANYKNVSISEDVIATEDGFYDLNGNILFETNGYSEGFKNGIACLENGEVIDRSGNTIMDLSDVTGKTSDVMPAEHLFDNLFIITDGQHTGLIQYKEEPAWNYEYVDFANTANIVKKENGYEFVMLDKSSIFVDNDGIETDNIVSVTGSNQHFNNQTKNIELYDNDNNKFAEFFGDDYFVNDSFKDYITVTSDDLWENKILKIYSKRNGKLVLDTKISEYLSYNIYGTGTIAIFEDGTFICNTEENKFGMADVYGNIVIECEYDDIVKYGYGFFGLKDGLWSCYNENEDIVQSFGEIKPETYPESDYVFFRDGNTTEVYDGNLKRTAVLEDYIVGGVPCDGTLLVSKGAAVPDGLINMKGEVIIPTGNSIEYMDKDVFCVNNEKLVKANGKVIADNCYYITDLGDDGYIGISTDDFEGYINSDGEKVLELKNDYLVHGTFSGGVAPVIKNEVFSRYGEVSYIDIEGNVMLKPTDRTWYEGYDFDKGLFFVGIDLSTEGIGGNILVKCTYDTPSVWAKDIVDRAIEYDILPQKQQRRYKRNITREDFCEIAYELPVIKNATVASAKSVSFTDTDNEKIEHLSSLGIIMGIGDGKFAPNNLINRQEAATILNRILSLSGETVSSGGQRFSDDNTISDWASDSVYSIKNAGIMQGVGDNMFAPMTQYTTEQAIITIVRLYEYE